MCGRTYGEKLLTRPDRCGVCITGLSLDGRPVWPIPPQRPGGRVTSPIAGEPLILLPGNVWSHDMTETSRVLGLDTSPEAELARAIRCMLGNWPGYRQLLIDEGIDPDQYARAEVSTSG